MKLNAQKKGKAGEVEFCNWLFDNFGIVVDRNHNQSNGHSTDVITRDFVFEVKRRESLDLDSWWHQVVVAKKRIKTNDLIPIVAYRQNRKPWYFLMPANLIHGVEKGYVAASERVFVEYAKNIIEPPEEVECSGRCDRLGIPNTFDGGYYCGSSPRCCP